MERLSQVSLSSIHVLYQLASLPACGVRVEEGSSVRWPRSRSAVGNTEAGGEEKRRRGLGGTREVCMECRGGQF